MLYISERHCRLCEAHPVCIWNPHCSTLICVFRRKGRGKSTVRSPDISQLLPTTRTFPQVWHFHHIPYTLEKYDILSIFFLIFFFTTINSRLSTSSLPTPQPSVEASKSFGVLFFFLRFPKVSGEFSSGSLHFLPSFRPSVLSTVSDGMVAVADVGLLGGQHCEGERSVKEKVKTYNREL